MDDEIFRVYPDREKARSILKMVETRLEMIKTLDAGRFASLIVEEYYDVIKELITAILLLDGFKTLSHVALIEYMRKNKRGLPEHGISLIDELRAIRNRITYDGFFVREDYLGRKRKGIALVIGKLKSLAENGLKQK